jgi:hypothetical protein
MVGTALLEFNGVSGTALNDFFISGDANDTAEQCSAVTQTTEPLRSLTDM